MFIDSLCEFDNDGSSGGATGVATTSLIKNAVSANLSASSTTGYSSFSYDTFAAGAPAPAIATQPGGIGAPLLHDIGRGRPVNLLIQVSTGMASSGSATVAVDFVNATSGTDLSVGTVVLESTPLIAIASLAQGYRFPLKTVPMKCLLRYVGLRYRNAVAAVSVGGIEATMATVADDHADAFGG